MPDPGRPASKIGHLCWEPCRKNVEMPDPGRPVSKIGQFLLWISASLLSVARYGSNKFIRFRLKTVGLHQGEGNDLAAPITDNCDFNRTNPYMALICTIIYPKCNLHTITPCIIHCMSGRDEVSCLLLPNTNHGTLIYSMHPYGALQLALCLKQMFIRSSMKKQ